MMMSYGTFVFSLTTLAYQELQRSQSWRFGATERVGARAALQYLGEGEDTIELSGLLTTELTGSRDSLDTLRDLAKAGQALPLVDGAGAVYGNYVITALKDTGTLHWPDGTPRRVDFGISFRRDDDAAAAAGAAP